MKGHVGDNSASDSVADGTFKLELNRVTVHAACSLSSHAGRGVESTLTGCCSPPMAGSSEIHGALLFTGSLACVLGSARSSGEWGSILTHRSFSSTQGANGVRLSGGS